MLNNTHLDDKIIIAALQCAENKRWSDVSLRDIANAANVSLSELHNEFPSKKLILSAFINRIDKEVLTQTEADADIGDETPRDRLFDVIMTRFTVMQPFKTAINSITKDLWKFNQVSNIPFTDFEVSMRWMLVAATLHSEGAKGRLRCVGLSKVYLDVFRIWLKDEDAGLAKTMAVLDKKLRQGETWLKRADTIMDEGSELFRRCLRKSAKPPFENNDVYKSR
ncbi:MAG: TetR/AcrR family transcriptional regulator [Pseudomonadota bacterium]